MATTSVNPKRKVQSFNRTAPQAGKNEAKKQTETKPAAEGKPVAASNRRPAEKASARAQSKDGTKEKAGNQAHGFVGGATTVAVTPSMNLLLGGPALSVDAIASSDAVKGFGNFINAAAGALEHYTQTDGDETANAYQDSDEELDTDRSSHPSSNLAGHVDSNGISREEEERRKLIARQSSKAEQSKHFMNLADEAASAMLKVNQIENGRGSSRGLTYARYNSDSAYGKFQESFGDAYELLRIRNLIDDNKILSNRDFNTLNDAAQTLDELKATASRGLDLAISRARSSFDDSVTKTNAEEMATGFQNGQPLLEEVLRKRFRLDLLTDERMGLEILMNQAIAAKDREIPSDGA
jgi:hypothetical protein